MKNQEQNYQNLEEARALDVPKREEVLRRDHSVREFWIDNKSLLADAWKEWEKSEKFTLMSKPAK